MKDKPIDAEGASSICFRPDASQFQAAPLINDNGSLSFGAFGLVPEELAVFPHGQKRSVHPIQPLNQNGLFGAHTTPDQFPALMNSPVSAEFTLILDLFPFRRQVHEGQMYMLEKVGITIQDVIFGAALVVAEIPHPLTYEQFVPQVGLDFIDDLDFEFIKEQIPGGVYNDPVTNLMEQYSQAAYMFYYLYYSHMNAVVLPFRSRIGWSKRVTLSNVRAQIQINTLTVLMRLEGEWP